MKTTVESSGSRQFLINTPIPEQTRTYKPISHSQIIDTTLDTIDRSGFKVENEIYSWSGNGQVALGKYTISNVADKEMQLQIAWQNSYNKQISLKFAIGVNVFICSNGCVSGDMGAFKKKHQGNVQEFTPFTITEYIKQSGDVFDSMVDLREDIKQIELSRRQQAEYIGRLMLEENIITSTDLNIINSELIKPTFDYGAKDSMWELYQFVTYALKNEHPSLWVSNHIKLHEFFAKEANVSFDKIINIRNLELANQLDLFENHEIV